jgi:prepilin peptidase CpaA
MIIASALPIAGFVGCVLTAAISDARTLRIPNILCGAIAALFAAHAAIDLTAMEAITAIGLAVVTLVAGFFAFARGKVGGGDVKLLAVCMAWAGPAHAIELLVVTGLVGGVIGLALLSPYLARQTAGLQRHWPQSETAATSAARAPMPYGVAIAAGALVVAARLMMS